MEFVSPTSLFLHSAEAFIAMLGSITDDQWQLPALGSWTVRSLAGHTARAILTVETYLSQEEPSDVSVPTAEAYFTSVYQSFTDPAAVAARGVDAGLWLADDPVGRVTSALDRSRSLIEAQPANRVVSIGGMGIPLAEYLRTRVFDLVVHTMDLSRATGIAHAVPSRRFSTPLRSRPRSP
jgi:uncharacterized protein (TIGR03083 family)